MTEIIQRERGIERDRDSKRKKGGREKEEESQRGIVGESLNKEDIDYFLPCCLHFPMTPVH